MWTLKLSENFFYYLISQSIDCLALWNCIVVIISIHHFENNGLYSNTIGGWGRTTASLSPACLKTKMVSPCLKIKNKKVCVYNSGPGFSLQNNKQQTPLRFTEGCQLTHWYILLYCIKKTIFVIFKSVSVKWIICF